MGLTSSLFAGLSGMKTNEFRMDVIGNNISNVNTNAYKSSNVNFQTQFLHTLSFGSAPSGNIGGTNPMQIGTGSMVGGISRNFSEGAPETTGSKTDLSIQGDGMFILQKPDGSQVYTRDGSFQFNAENYLLSSDGYFLQGYNIDKNFNIVEGSLHKLRIPLGEITTAALTSHAQFSGDLNAAGNPAIDPVTGYANGNVRTVLNDKLSDNGGPLTTSTLLTNLQNEDGENVVLDGNVITMDEASKGGKTLPAESFTVSATSTLGDFMTWLQGVLGINTSSKLPDFTSDPSAVSNPGVRINSAGDAIEVVGNIGTLNKIELGNKAMKVTQGTATGIAAAGSLPFDFSVPNGFTQADVESVRTSFRAYDSLGSPMDVDITLVMQSKNPTGGITWRYFAECGADSDADRTVGTGTITFDANGKYLDGSDLNISIDRAGTGAATPQTIAIDFSEMDGFSMKNAISLFSQDGFQSGTLQDYSIGPDGIITGSFTNGLTRSLGQVVMATFRNYEGLVADAGNVYTTGPNSGSPVVKKPQELGAGTINAGALELSNVDLSREFINLIISNNGFSAATRVIQTSNKMMNELMMLTR